MIDQVDEGEGYAGLAAKLNAAKSFSSQLRATLKPRVPPRAKKARKKKIKAPKAISDSEFEVLEAPPALPQSPLSSKDYRLQEISSSDKRKSGEPSLPRNSKRRCVSEENEGEEVLGSADGLRSLGGGMLSPQEAWQHSVEPSAQKQDFRGGAQPIILDDDDDDIILLCSQSQRQEPGAVPQGCSPPSGHLTNHIITHEDFQEHEVNPTRAGDLDATFGDIADGDHESKPAGLKSPDHPNEAAPRLSPTEIVASLHAIDDVPGISPSEIAVDEWQPDAVHGIVQKTSSQGAIHQKVNGQISKCSPVSHEHQKRAPQTPFVSDPTLPPTYMVGLPF